MEDLGFKTTTHNGCVHKRTSLEGTILIMRQVDDFLTGTVNKPWLREWPIRWEKSATWSWRGIADQVPWFGERPCECGCQPTQWFCFNVIQRPHWKNAEDTPVGHKKTWLFNVVSLWFGDEIWQFELVILKPTNAVCDDVSNGNWCTHQICPYNASKKISNVSCAFQTGGTPKKDDATALWHPAKSACTENSRPTINL